jgi:hypothetical protein
MISVAQHDNTRPGNTRYENSVAHVDAVNQITNELTAPLGSKNQ